MNDVRYGYAKKDLLFDNAVFVDGLARAGKMLTCEILSRLDKMDFFQTQPAIEAVCYLWHVGGIDDAYAVPYLQTLIDELIYNRAIGRHLNTRLDDHSSIMRAPDPKQYIQRTIAEGGMDAVDRFNENGQVPIFLTHTALPMAELFFEAFPSATIVHSNRHPVDQTFEWDLRGWGWREVSDPLSFQPLVDSQYGRVPWFAKEWAREYATLNQMETAVMSVIKLQAADDQAYDTMSKNNKSRIYRFSFERLVTEPETIIDNFCSFLNTEPITTLRPFLEQERCPRVLGPAERTPMLEHIRAAVSDDVFASLLDASRAYETRWGLESLSI